MNKVTIAAAVITLPLAFSTTAQTQRMFDWDQVTAGINLGTLSGLTRERAYDPGEGGRKVSQLDWKYNNAAVVQGSLEWEAMPWLSLGGSGWTTLARKGSQMDDYDWLLRSQDSWTDHSTHPDTRLNFANQWDLHMTGWVFNEPTWRLGVQAGYQQSRYSFNARGGRYNYDNGATVGTFANVMTIGYKQRFDIPYIGLTGHYRYSNFEAGGSFKYSAWVRGESHDEHYLRDLAFTDKTNNQDFFSLSANLGYYVTKNAKVFIEGTWNRTTNKKSSTAIKDYAANTRATYGDTGGIESYSFLTTAGLKYTF